MLPGLSGPLVSEFFAEKLLPELFAGRLGEQSCDAARRGFLRWRRQQAGSLGPANGPRQVFDRVAMPLLAILGFEPREARLTDGGRSVVSRLPLSDGTRCLLFVTGWGEGLDAAWRAAVRESLAAAAPWCLCTNGASLRLVDARRTYSRRFLEFDVELALDSPESFRALWALVRPAAILARTDSGLSLLDEVVQASARHTVGVCRSLREGVLEALVALLEQAPGIEPPRGRPGSARSFPLEQALTLVYRILFLLFAESRQLLPVWHPLYRDGYSMEAAVTLAESSSPRGLWETLRAMSRLAHSGCCAGDLEVTPFNGRLFSPHITPLGESDRITDRVARTVVLALSGTLGRRGASRARIVYRDLDVEQLGAVYESVLDYRPVTLQAPASGTAGTTAALSAGGRKRSAVALRAGSGLRKSTGTFYTPRAIASYLVRRTLAPLVRDRSPEEVLALKVVDPAMGSGAFLVAACRYLAAAYETAVIEAGGCHPQDIGDGDRRGFRRLVAQHCLYGVDLNPMAVQLARLSLWLVTLAPDKPLTFLDHRLAVGDSLVGTSVAEVLRRPPPGTRASERARGVPPPLPLFGEDRLSDDIQSILPRRSALATVPDDTLAAVREKERLLADLGGEGSRTAFWRTIADLWCAHAFVPGRPLPSRATIFRAIADGLISGRPTLPPHQVRQYLESLEAAAASRRFFHWPLEFPEAFFGADGLPFDRPGFDAVIGNPPWDMIRADEEGLWKEPDHRVRGAETMRRPRTQDEARSDNAMLVQFARSSGAYRGLGDGHANRFQLFLERSLRLVRQGGRVGLVLPWGLAVDRGCEPLRRALMNETNIDAVVGFDNTDRIFPIHRSVRFVLLTTTVGGRTEAVRCRLGERDPSVLDAMPSEGGDQAAFPVQLSRPLLEHLSKNLVLPDVRTGSEVALLDKLHHAAPPLGSPDGWGAEFGRELNATDDRSHFSDDPEGLPVVEGKHLAPFRVQISAEAPRLSTHLAERLLVGARTWRRARLAYRDVASATNRLTVIAAVLPPGCVTVHTLFCLKTQLPVEEQHLLCAFLNSFVVNYLARVRVTTHVSAGLLSQIPVPRPARGSSLARHLVRLASELASAESPEAEWRYAELQAGVARTYGLTVEEFKLVLSTFPLVPEAVRSRCLHLFAAGTADGPSHRGMG